tara:strand:- start:6819 stop:7244 length:426 start_codon:yes stop_codon:yes gene_type:complete
MQIEPGSLGGGMHTTTEIEHESNLCVWRVNGRAELEPLQAAYLERFDLPGWWPGILNLSILTDTRLDLFNPGEAEKLMRFMAIAAAKHGVGDGFFAAIACADPDSRTLLSYWDRRAPAGMSGENRTFADEKTARAWLAGQV